MSAGPDPDWVAARREAAARALRRAVSATGLSRHRAGFGWTVVPARGSILASTRVASWDPEPDYFHHWTRDAAIALAAIPEAMAAEPKAAAFWRQAVADHVRFSLAISDPDRRGPPVNPLKDSATEAFRPYLRPDAELAALTGAAWLAEPRCAADGGPDLERWGRPQYDGPALRAAALMRLGAAMPEARGPEADRLIARDLDFTLAMAGAPCLGPWEEEPARRSGFTLIAQWDALELGARRLGRADLAGAAETVADLIAEAADPVSGGWRESLEVAPDTLDAATVLALVQAGRSDGPFALTAPRTRATMAALETLFAGLYPLNHGRAAPALGRWAEDVFCGGNPWFPVTLGFAEAHYRIAAATGDAAEFGRAEALMAVVEDLAPEGDDLPEQADRRTGAPTSCLGLTWSAAAFLMAAAARDQALAAR
ncbi:glycoside hydrolase family 15 protein [Rhodovulum kholense]|uniref:glucan 1,4-alpha-glucosidase n=1 Tax=Rhodovulum kholense TaxID=453584 RepID=A0A8E3ARX9_9RHOB|nr:glycoside hydrolase family 15 protein [Rhodovulum kholense]PTW51017.1 glucoamylase [Rhodovulum kholense]